MGVSCGQCEMLAFARPVSVFACKNDFRLLGCVLGAATYSRECHAQWGMPCFVGHAGGVSEPAWTGELGVVVEFAVAFGSAITESGEVGFPSEFYITDGAISLLGNDDLGLIF